MLRSRFGALKEIAARPRSRIAFRLLFSVLLFSSTITLFLTLFQLYLDYDHGMEVIENRLTDINKSSAHSLGEALWRLDEQQLRVQLNGILQLSDIRAAEVREMGGNENPFVVKAGQRVSRSFIVREFPLVYRIEGRDQMIGMLYVQATLTNLYKQLANTVLIIMITQGAKTFLVSLFIIYLFHCLVTRHLEAIAAFVGNYDFRNPPFMFRLHRRPSLQQDELDKVVVAFNALCVRLHDAYSYLRQANAGLQQENEERRRIEIALREAQRAAEAAARTKSAFLANMSHELRTPLNSILGYTQILLRNERPDEQQRTGLNAIQHSGEHLLMLINDILDFAKIEAGKQEPQLADMPLIGFLRVIADIIGIRARQKDIDFTCDMAPDLPACVRADEKRLRQVLLNLLSNAVNFTDHGQVRLRVTFSPPCRLRFEVEDTGIGISKEQLGMLFQSFEEIDDVQFRAIGTGLGLAISRQLVKMMGGDIKVESRTGEGSRLWFELDLPVVDSGWTDDLVQAAPSGEDSEIAPLVAPPQQEMEDLYRLAQLGNMKEILQQADYLDELDESYRPFASQLRQLAKGYQSKAISSLVTRYLKKKEVPGP